MWYSLVSSLYGSALLVIISSVILIMGTQSLSESSQLELEANAILSSGWWNTSDPYFNISLRCDQWEGIACNKAGSITQLRYEPYYYYEAAGIHFATLNLSAFRNLESLYVSGAGMVGSIPPQIGTLSKLTYLGLSHYSLEGEIPSSLGSLKNLITLYLSHNKINGTLPISLTNLTQLEEIYISNNLLIGPLPSNLDRLTSLQRLRLNNNSISGDIPPQLEYLTHLLSLDLSCNNLTGIIPQLFVPEYVNMSYNYLKGPIPYGNDGYDLTGNKNVCTDISYYQIKFQFQPCLSHNKTSDKMRKTKHILVIVLPILCV